MKRLVLTALAAIVLTVPAYAPAYAHDQGDYVSPYSWGYPSHYDERPSSARHHGHDHDWKRDRDDWNDRDYSRYDRDDRADWGRRPVVIRFGSRDEGLIISWFGSRRYVDLSPVYLPAPAMRAIRASYGRHQPPCALPPGLARRLAPAPAGYERVMVGDDVLLVQLTTGFISDVISLR